MRPQNRKNRQQRPTCATNKLDDGWPESVEEQGLLLVVWRHHITKQYVQDVLYAVEKRSIKTISHKYKTIVCIANTFTHRNFYTEQAFTQTTSYTEKLLQTGAFTHRHFYTQTLLHTRHFYTQTLLHTGAFTYRQFYTQALLHTVAFTQTLLHTKLLPTEALTDRSFYTQTLLHRRF